MESIVRKSFGGDSNISDVWKPLIKLHGEPLTIQEAQTLGFSGKVDPESMIQYFPSGDSEVM